MRLLALAALLLSAAACGGGDGGGGGDEDPGAPLPEGVTALGADARIALPPPQDPRCQPPSTRKVFRMDAEWEGYWTYGFEGCPRPALPTGFDWSREMLVLAAMGRRGSAADSITVRGSGVVGDSMLIVLRRTTRQSPCSETAVRVWPRDLVRIPVSDRPAKFVEEHVKLPCPQ
ncbi:MAG TPA: hypothetical protein VFR37_05285 [Longimicrobium sp.]|nr:hypothetical protein [Longimicrobium sp.]